MHDTRYTVTSAQTEGQVRLRRAQTTNCDPLSTIPAQEQWIWRNNDAMQSFARGKEDARNGRLHDLGSFAQFVDLDTDE